MKNDKVEIGQIWESMDPRAVGRRIEIINVMPEYAVVSSKRGLRNINLERFTPDSRGYRLVPFDELSR